MLACLHACMLACLHACMPAAGLPQGAAAPTEGDDKRNRRRRDSRHGPAYDLPTVMTKWLVAGLPLHEVVRASTCNPAAAIGWGARDKAAARPFARCSFVFHSVCVLCLTRRELVGNHVSLGDRIGSLAVGRVADITVLEQVRRSRPFSARWPHLGPTSCVHRQAMTVAELGLGQVAVAVDLEDCQSQLRPCRNRLVCRAVWKDGDALICCPGRCCRCCCSSSQPPIYIEHRSVPQDTTAAAAQPNHSRPSLDCPGW